MEKGTRVRIVERDLHVVRTGTIIGPRTLTSQGEITSFWVKIDDTSTLEVLSLDFLEEIPKDLYIVIMWDDEEECIHDYESFSSGQQAKQWLREQCSLLSESEVIRGSIIKNPGIVSLDENGNLISKSQGEN